MRKREK
jgi:hypothetical protein